MMRTATRRPAHAEDRPVDGPRASLGWWVGAVVAWLVAGPAFVFTVLLEWGIVEEYGTENVGQYALALPALLLVALAGGLTWRAAGRSRGGLVPVVVALVLVAVTTAVVVLLAPV